MMLRAVAALIASVVLVCAPAAARQAAAVAQPGASAAVLPQAGAAAAAAPQAGAQVAAVPVIANVATVAPARAQPPRQLPQPAVPMAAASAGSLLQTVFGLAVVLATLALFAWAMKRYGPRQPAGAAGLRIVSALNLGGRERIIVVEVGDQWIVVGASPGRVNALATMPKQHTEPGPAMLNPYAPSASSFAEWLKQTIEKRNAK